MGIKKQISNYQVGYYSHYRWVVCGWGHSLLEARENLKTNIVRNHWDDEFLSGYGYTENIVLSYQEVI